MKKTLYIIAIFLFTILITACGSEEKLNLNETKSDTFEELSYEVPKAFKKENDEEDFSSDSLIFSDYFYTYDNKGANGKYDDMCMILFSVDLYDYSKYSLEEYVNMSKSKNEEIEKKTINGIEWYILTSTEGDNMLSYDYYAYYNNKYYHMGYDDFGSGNLCKESLDVIENSLKFE